MSARGAHLGVAVGVCALVAGAAAGCRSVRTDEALAMLDVSAAPGVPPFTTARFSVAGRPEIPPHEVRYDGRAPLRFGYYLPGPNGTLRISGQALSASCLVGVGTVEVDVRLGQVSTPMALVIASLAQLDPSCLASGDGGRDGVGDGGQDAVGDGGQDGMGGAGGDAASDATASDASDVRPTTDAGADTGPTDAAADMMSVPPPPVCMDATRPCPGASACCSGLVCGTTTLGRVCCGNFNMTCSRSGGEDCCGQLECVSNHCCLPATYACSGGSCCPGLVCGTTTLGRVCCGNSGAPCKRPDGADCCGALECDINASTGKGTCR